MIRKQKVLQKILSLDGELEHRDSRDLVSEQEVFSVFDWYG